MPVPRRSPSVSPSQQVRALGADGPGARVQVVREPALEVLVRVLAVVADVDVDRLPPLRVGLAVGEHVEDGLGRRVDVPLVDELVLAVRQLEDRAREPLLGLQARAGGVAGRAEVVDEPRAGERAREAEPVELRCVSPRRSRNSSICAGGRVADADAADALAAGALVVRRAGRDLDRVAGVQRVDLAVQLDVQHALDHLVALGHADVDVHELDEPARAADHVELRVLAAGGLGGRADLEPQVHVRHLDHVARLDHLRILLDRYARCQRLCAA